MLNSGVLVLNRAFFPVHVTNVRRGFCLLYSGLAKAINSSYEMFDFQSWSELSIHAGDEAVGLVGRTIR
ncbi:MAG: HNH endonuclease, partial [Deltaproteobacteria bacterium]